MSAILALLVVSAASGLLMGLKRVWFGALGISGVILAIAAAIMLRRQDFSFFAGVGIIVGCLGLNQIVYFIGVVLAGPEDAGTSLGSQQPDAHPDDDGEKDVTSEHKQQNETPSRSHSPNEPL
jgi:hypothetical protein